MTNFAVGTFHYNENVTVWNWFGSDPSDYFDTSNWSAGTAPNGVDAVAMLGYQDAARTMPQPATTVTLSSNLTLGTLIFDNPNSYTINGSGRLTLQASEGDAQVIVNQGMHVINATTNLATTTDIYLSSGCLKFTSPITASSGTGLNEFGSGTLKLTGITADSLAINGTKVVISAGSPVSSVKSLSIEPGSILDLNSDMIINYTGDSPLASIKAMLATAYDGGAWDGTSSTIGVITSSSAANLYSTWGAPITSIACAEALQLLGISGSETGTFDGQTVDATSIILKYVVAGDVNMDGVVNQYDLNIISEHWQDTGADWLDGDVNGDGVVNQEDLNIVSSLWQETLSVINTWGSPEVVVAPEPATVFAVFLVILPLERRRRSLYRDIADYRSSR